MRSAYHSYPKIYNLGHRYLEHLLEGPVVIEEKIDGSQFSFGKFSDSEGNEYVACRSKGAQINTLAPVDMFKKAVATAMELEPLLTPGWCYRGEYLSKPKHNTLAYDRHPEKHIILFDINTGLENYISYDSKKAEAERIGLEITPRLYEGEVSDVQLFRDLLDKTSILGGQQIEGIVIKNHARFGIDGKPLMGKFVSEKYKEVHNGDWKERNPANKDVIAILIAKYKTPARWEKAYQHLLEDGKIEFADKDIGELMKEIPNDTKAECEEAIKDELFRWAWPKLKRGISNGAPEWYKEKLMERQINIGEK